MTWLGWRPGASWRQASDWQSKMQLSDDTELLSGQHPSRQSSACVCVSLLRYPAKWSFKSCWKICCREIILLFPPTQQFSKEQTQIFNLSLISQSVGYVTFEDTHFLTESYHLQANSRQVSACYREIIVLVKIALGSQGQSPNTWLRKTMEEIWKQRLLIFKG